MDTENSYSSSLCRACLCSSGDLRSLLDSTDLFITFEHITCLQIRESDELPQNICMKCTFKLEDISRFISTCKASDAHLRKLVEKDNNSDTFETFVEDDFVEEHNSKGTSESTPLLDSKPDVELLVSSTTKQNVSKSKRRKRPEDCSCDTCGKQFTRLGGLQRHMKIHLGIRPFKCKSCNKTFAQKATLERHYLTHTGEKPFECNLCGKVGRRKDQLIEHIQKHHSNVTDFDLVITEHDRANSGSLGVEAEIKETSVEESKVLEPEENPSEIKEVKYKTKKRIEICLCNLCGKVFQRRGYLKNHMAIHATVKPFICNICGRGFTQRHSLTRHNLVHTKERPFQCSLCGKTFTRKEILTEHIKSHDGASPYLCFHCGKYFSNKDYLKKHLNYHVAGKRSKKNSDKKCVCSHCGKQLHSISYLKTHLLMHSGEKPYECNICGNRFTIQRSLNHHLNIHKGIKPYQCTQCEKAFRTSGSLRKHVLLHTGERPYKCTSCDKGFIRRSHLKRHFRTH